MVNTVEKHFVVAGKTVIVVYDFSFYSEKEYKLDFRDFVGYHTKKEQFAEKDEGDWKFLKLKEYKFIPFADFIKIVSELLAKVLAQILKEDPSIMVSDENQFKIYFIFIRVLNRDWYFEENPRKEIKDSRILELLDAIEADSIEHHEYLSAGVFFIQAVAAPWYYFKRFNYTYVYRYLRHELEHHKQKMAEFYKFEDEVVKRLRIKVKKAPNYRITYLFLTFHGLFNEGIADFVTITNRAKVDIHMDWIYKFRIDLDALTTMTGKNKVHKFWVDNLAYGVFAGGAYYCGKIMCFTIALAFAKRINKEPLIYLENGEEYPLDAIDKIMGKHKVFFIGNVDNIVFKRAYEEIKKYNYDYRKFILLYDWACKELSIRKRNRVMWCGFFDDLKKKATKFYERYSEKRRAELYKRIKGIRRVGYSV